MELGAALVNVAGDLPAIGVAQHGNVHQAERLLRRAVYLAGQQNGTGTGAKECAAICGKLFQCGEKALFGEHLNVSGTFAARQDDPGKAGKIFRPAHEDVLDAETVEGSGVRLVVSFWIASMPIFIEPGVPER